MTNFLCIVLIQTCVDTRRETAYAKSKSFLHVLVLIKLPFVRRLKDLHKKYFDCIAALKLLKEGGLDSTAVVVRETNIKR